MVDILDYLQNHVWVPILVGIALFLILALVTYKLCKYCGNRRRYDYTQIQEDMALPRKMEMERQAQIDEVREAALIDCQFYLRSTGIYRMSSHLNDIGSRKDKHWFMVYDSRPGRRRPNDKILALIQKEDRMQLPCNRTTSNTLVDLFKLIQNTYIYSVEYIDFMLEKEWIVVTMPFSAYGSLKDLIYGSRCLDTWRTKYGHAGSGLQISQIKLLGKQILQALLYLQDKGFPAHGHLHSGNIIMDGKGCRLAGYENSILNLPSKLATVLRRPFREYPHLIDSISLGHLIYEMAKGKPLETIQPDAHQLVTMPPDVRDVIQFILKEGEYPTLKEIDEHRFFQNVAGCNNIPNKVRLTSEMKSLLKALRKGKILKRRKSSVAPSVAESNRKASIQDVKISDERTKPQKPKTKPKKSRSSNAGISEKPGPSAGSRIPPPPPVAAPPPPKTPAVSTAAPNTAAPDTAGRGMLLGDIRKGMRLKKTVTVDKSKPKI